MSFFINVMLFPANFIERMLKIKSTEEHPFRLGYAAFFPHSFRLRGSIRREKLKTKK